MEGMQLRDLKTASSEEVSAAVARSRREFLWAAAGVTAGSLFSFAPRVLRAAALRPEPKAVVVTFGGGARDEETFAPEGQENIPNLVQTLFPQSTFFAQVINK